MQHPWPAAAEPADGAEEHEKELDEPTEGTHPQEKGFQPSSAQCLAKANGSHLSNPAATPAWSAVLHLP